MDLINHEKSIDRNYDQNARGKELLSLFHSVSGSEAVD
jgi:hypothetical protein